MDRKNYRPEVGPRNHGRMCNISSNSVKMLSKKASNISNSPIECLGSTMKLHTIAVMSNKVDRVTEPGITV